jgi:hypothetical protein
MIIEQYKNSALCACDICGKQTIKYKSYMWGNHYCSRDHYQQARQKGKTIKAKTTKITFKKDYTDRCLVCHKPYNDSFYDKGSTGRYLCSTACRDIYFDNRPEPLGGMTYEKQYDYIYPHQGRLVLSEYNLSRIF